MEKPNLDKAQEVKKEYIILKKLQKASIKNNLNSRGDKDDSIFATWHFDNFDKSFKK